MKIVFQIAENRWDGHDEWRPLSGTNLPEGYRWDYFEAVSLCIDDTQRVLGVRPDVTAFTLELRRMPPGDREHWAYLRYGAGWVAIGDNEATLTCFQEAALEKILPSKVGYARVTQDT